MHSLSHFAQCATCLHNCAAQRRQASSTMLACVYYTQTTAVPGYVLCTSNSCGRVHFSQRLQAEDGCKALYPLANGKIAARTYLAMPSLAFWQQLSSELVQRTSRCLHSWWSLLYLQHTRARRDRIPACVVASALRDSATRPALHGTCLASSHRERQCNNGQHSL